MKILMVGFDAPWINTGFAATLRAVGGELLKRGHQVYSISGNFVFETDGPILHNGIIVLSNKGMMYPDTGTFLRHYNEVNPDIVIAHNDFYRIKYFSKLSEDILDKTLVWLPIEDTDSLGELEGLRKLKNIAFTTKYGMNLYKRLLPEQRLFQINHQIGITDASDPIPSIDMDKLTNKFVVLRVDRNQERKNWPHTLESFQSFIKNDCIKDAILIAKTRKKDVASSIDLGELVKKLEIEDNVIFVENELTSPQMRWLYESADVFLSTTGSEGFGLSIGEAMACGKPILCTGCAPLFDVVGRGAGSFINVVGKEYNTNVHVSYNKVDIAHAAKLLADYYADWKNGGSVIAKEGLVAKRHANAYKIERVVDDFESAFEKMSKPYKKVLVSVATRNRPDALVALLTSLFNQAYKNISIYIFDNSDNEDLLKNNAFLKQMKLFNDSGQTACVWKNNEQNCPDTHQKIFDLAKKVGCEFVFKVDDDCILESNTIEVLMDDIQQDDKIAAVGCSILEPDKLTNKIMPIDYPAQTLANLWYNRQWMWDKELKQTEVEHLYSSFIYRTSAMDAVGGFAGGLSKVAFREETLTTYPMVLKGWKLHYNPAAIMWHMKSDRGGCRDFHIEELYKRDEAIFNERIKKMKEDNNA